MSSNDHDLDEGLSALILHAFDEHRATIAALQSSAVGPLREMAQHLAGRLGEGGLFLVCGNGGSAADAQHLVAELIGGSGQGNPPLRAIALTTDTSTLTAVANDLGYEEVFARQVRALGRSGDVLLAISTSGASANCIHAARAAREQGMTVLVLTGGRPSPLSELGDVVLGVPSEDTTRIQEGHSLLLHLLCETTHHLLGAS